MIAYFGPASFLDRESILSHLETFSDAKLIAVDVESVSLVNLAPVGLSIAVNPTEAFYFTMHPELDEAFPWRMLTNPEVKKVFHNALFDLSVLDELGLDETNIDDTMIMARLECMPSALSDLAAIHGIEAHSMSEYLGKGQTVLDLDPGLVARKCCQDSLATIRVFHEMPSDTDKEYYGVELSLIPLLIDMSNKGLMIDQDYRARLQAKLENDVEYFLGICSQEGFNPASPQQVGYTLAKRNNLLPIRRRPNSKTGKWEMKIATGAEILEKLEDPLAAVILDYRKSSKLLSTYILPLAGHPRAFTRWHTDAITGRISSTKQNLQNIPPSIRGMFIPDGGVFTDWDASQIELRCLTYMSEDREMSEIFNTGGDIHQATADFMGIDRKVAKNVNFAMLYGATVETIAETAHIPNIRRARQLRDMWFNKYTDAGRWITMQQQRGWEDGYVETLFGRKIKLPIDVEKQSDIYRKAVNYPIQGSAAEIIKRVMLKCKHLPLTLQVHDELVADGNVAEEVKSLPLETVSPVRTPFSVRLMDRWE